MHELSIAMSIVDIAAEEAQRRGCTQVNAVYVKLGRLSGVVEEALRSSYEMACDETLLKGSRLEIESIPVTVYCPQCQAERWLESIQNFCCSECGTRTAKVLSGKEIEVFALEVTQ